MARAFRDVESFAVPLKDFLGLLQRREQRIAARVIRRRDIVPADFLLRVSINRGAERLGDQLRAEANAQHRHLPAHRLFDQFQFGHQMRQLIGVVDAHRSAQHDQPVITVQARLGVRVAREINVANAKTGALQ